MDVLVVCAKKKQKNVLVDCSVSKTIGKVLVHSEEKEKGEHNEKVLVLQLSFCDVVCSGKQT